MFEQAKQQFIEGNAHFEAGRYAEAERCFEASLKLLPGRPSTLANLAATRIRLGRPEAALPLLDEVLAANADDVDARLHHAAALSALGRDAEALPGIERVLAAQPDRAEAWHQYGSVLALLHRHEESFAAFARLTQLQPGRASAWANHGQALQRLDRFEEALVSFDRALSLDADWPTVWSQRGSILKELGRCDEAITSFRESLARGGDESLNRYFLGALGADQAPDSAPRGYVEALFDNYAPSFDEHLVGALGYRAHIVLIEQLAALGARRYSSVLDLGCGTGLCGPLVRPLADRLVGVDLSQAMLARARSLGVYDELLHGDAVAHLQVTEERHDLLLAADVFIYIGRLEATFAAARRVLRPGGVFAFSVERADDAHDVQLTGGLRYAHSHRHLRALAAQHGFEWLSALAHPIREDQRQPIDGLFVCLRRG